MAEILHLQVAKWPSKSKETLYVSVDRSSNYDVVINNKRLVNIIQAGILGVARGGAGDPAPPAPQLKCHQSRK